MFLGIDQSYTSTGIVRIEHDQIKEFGIFQSDKLLDIFDRSCQVASFIVKSVKENRPTVITLEGLAFGMRGDATRDLAGLQFTIINALRRDCGFVAIHIVSPKTLKKFATGDGKAKKIEMIEKLPKKAHEMFTAGGFKKTTGMADLADAYWLSKYAEKLSVK